MSSASLFAVGSVAALAHSRLRARTSSSPLDHLRPKYDAAGQGHVFRYADEGKLSREQEIMLAEQLGSLDLEQIMHIHKEAIEFDKAGQKSLGKLEPLASYDSAATAPGAQLKAWEMVGFQAISEGKVAALVMAGGAGTRLGFAAPKGMYDLGLPSGKSLFQLYAERLRQLAYLASVATGSPQRPIPWYIMTSCGDNHRQTTEFFKQNSYFGYEKEDVMFFSQGTLPCFTEEGKIMLETGYKVSSAADGNGGLYMALQKTGQLDDMKKRGVEFVQNFAVDNAVNKACDPRFVGYCISKGADCGNKVLWKAEPGEKIAVIGKRGGKFAFVEYSEMSDDDKSRTDSNGKLVYGAGHICNHFFSTRYLEEVSHGSLLFHVARKKIPTPSADGQAAVTPTENNGIKLEAFIFDPFDRVQVMAVYEGVRAEDFSPVKNAPGSAKDSPDTARAMLTEQSKRWLQAGSIQVIDGPGQLEVGPFVSYRGEGMKRLRQELGGPVDCSKGDVVIDADGPGAPARQQYR